MTYLFNKLDQAYVGANKSFDKGIYAFRSSRCCHCSKKNIHEGNMVPKSA